MEREPHWIGVFAAARARTAELFNLIAPDALYDRPIPERHRLIFYLGHLEAFDWNQIGRGALGLSSFHPEFDKLFEFGIDPPVGRPPEDRIDDWPSVPEISRYNSQVRETIDRAIERNAVPSQILHVAVEHRLMHAETLAYMLHNLPANRKIAPPGDPIKTSATPFRPSTIEVSAGEATLGRKRGNGFGWDNEFDELHVDVPPFAMGKYKVTNGQYLDFVRAGAAPPHFWLQQDGNWFQKTMFGLVPLPLDWPVYVTHKQAADYAKWAGGSLPTEAQFHRAAYDGDPANCDFQSWHPVPVTASENNSSRFSQLIGNGWEWTSTVFEPFPGFEPFPFYPGYSANFFDGDHYVLKGASARTAACFLRPSFRNWFRPDYPYMYAGFRCVEN